MSRRWKIGIVLGVVGMAFLLVWAFCSTPVLPLSLRFQGYVTNDEDRVICEFCLPPGTIAALFVASNQSERVLAAHASYLLRTNGVETSYRAIWKPSFHDDLSRALGFPTLLPGRTVGFYAPVLRTDEPVRMIIDTRQFRESRSVFGRYWNRLPWNQRRFFATATNELR